MELKEIVGCPPPHAILSHRWEAEITVQEFQAAKNVNKSGYRKIEESCRLINQYTSETADALAVWKQLVTDSFDDRMLRNTPNP